MLHSRHAKAPLLIFVCGLFAACGPDSSSKGADAGAPSADSGTEADGSTAPDATPTTASLDTLLADLRNDRDAAMLAQSRAQGWPAPVEDGYLFVSTVSESLLAGDHDSWQGAAMTAEDDFHWLVVSVSAGNRYKFTDGDQSWVADRWSRSYQWDNEGEMSMVTPTTSHLERHFQVSDANIPARRLRIWIPEAAATHVLYTHDGQNLFDPAAIWGGWKLDASAPAALMIVGIDNNGGERMNEYTHTTDNLGDGEVGGDGDNYAAYVHVTVRALVAQHYGEPAKVGTMGSSLGGLIALHIADRYPEDYDFAASLSGTLGWGSIGGTGADTIIARYEAAGKRNFAIYIDSGGSTAGCTDTDEDGTDDDGNDSDNYCVNRQMETVLAGLGYTYDTDLWHWWDTNAEHNEAAWSARVFRPMQNFMGL